MSEKTKQLALAKREETQAAQGVSQRRFLGRGHPGLIEASTVSGMPFR